MTAGGDPDWEALQDAFDEASALAPAERAPVLARLGNAALRRELEAMLAAHDRHRGILDRSPALAAAAAHGAAQDAADAEVRQRLQRALAERYTIDRPIGRGGSAVVYLAREHKHDRAVVLKVLHPEVAAMVGVKRFADEVRIAAQLSHPHILPLIDSGEVDGLLYYVMPFLEGETLRHRLIARGAIAPSEAVPLLRDVAEALRAVHAAGIVHRDLKPENILLAGDHAYLLDFGIAMREAQGAPGPHRHTHEGVVVGTLGYMSPEQTHGRAIDAASDVYAWGVLAREMLTGKGPLTPDADLDAVPAPPRVLALVHQALDEDPRARPANADELFLRLGAIGAGERRGSSQAVRRARRWSALSVGLSLAAVAGMALFTWYSVTPRGPLAAPVAVVPLRNETGDSTLGIWGRLAADWLTQGLHQTDLVTVVPWPTVRQAAEQLARDSADASAEAIAREVGAATVVSGNFFQTGDRIGFRLDVTDVRRGTLIASLPPITAPRDSLESAVREARSRLMGLVAVRADERAEGLPGLAAHPPTFDAYRAFDRGLGLFNEQEYGAAATEFRQAWAADNGFPVPLIYAAMAHWNLGEFDWVDTLLVTARAHEDDLSEYDQAQVEYLAALLASDGPRAVAAGTRATSIAPESRAAYNLGRDLVGMDRVADARRVLEGIDADRGLMRGWPSYWTQLTHAQHLAGDHAAELQSARAMRERFPDSRVAWTLEARALAALGDRRALDSLLALTEALPPGVYWSHAAALVIAGEELWAHQDSTLGRPYLEWAVNWTRVQLRADAGRREHRYWQGAAAYDLADWTAADTLFGSLTREFPDRLVYRGMAAIARARHGDAPGATQALGPAPTYARGEHTLYRARVAFALGDTASAAALRAQALNEVVSGWAWVHASGFRDLPPRR